jgi:hypothetical protein
MSGILAKIDDLILQAATERSHYYTAATLREARDEIERLTRERDDALSSFTAREGVEWMKTEDIDRLQDAEEERDKLRGLVQCLLDNEPDDVVADGGITVLMVWRQDARRALGLPEERQPEPEFDL